ncbi:hypothetical protein DFH09DRAFT_1319311 [Mycena vulgaris]|nr:hypothetical protein DFH09DRAFT_1319311 [Mycena vulgaris]
MGDYEHLCLLSALSPKYAGPFQFVSTDSYHQPAIELGEVACRMTAEIVEDVGWSLNVETTRQIVERSLTLSTETQGNFETWLEEYLGRTGRHTYGPEGESEDEYFTTAVVIGPKIRGGNTVLRRVEDYHGGCNAWVTLVVDSENGEEERIYSENDSSATTRYGFNPEDPFFCWERPYRYFEDWMKRYCPRLASWEEGMFLEQFYRVFADYEYDLSGLLNCISYGGIEKTHMGGFQHFFAGARTQSRNTAAAIAVGARGKDLWPALALDFGVWMASRPDLWPANPPALDLAPLRIETGAPSAFHALPSEVLIQILPLLPVADLLFLLLLSRGVSELVSPLLNETLWHHVHHGDFRWILPVDRVKGEVERANGAGLRWHPNPTGLVCVFDSRDFPFSRFLPECLNANSMRNRQRLWNIYKQYKDLWENMYFDI